MRFNFFFFYSLLCLVRKGYQFNLLREHIRLVISSFITNITYIAYIAYIEYMQFWITRLQGIRLLHDKRSGRDHLRVPPSCWRDLRELSRCLHLHKESGPVLFFLSWQVYFFRIIYKKSTINLFTVWHQQDNSTTFCFGFGDDVPFCKDPTTAGPTTMTTTAAPGC